MKLLTQIAFLVVILFPFHLQTNAAPSTSTSTICTKSTSHSMASKKPHVVLVHGFTSGGWYWYRVRISLESLGYNVTSIDLKGAGIDPNDGGTIDTIEQYNEPLDHFMAHFPQHEKVVLVGQSAGGVSITKILHDYPEKIQVAMYVAATMIRNGYTTCEHLIIGVPHFNESKCYASCPKLPDPTCFVKAFVPSFNSEAPLGSMAKYMLDKSLARTGPLRAVCTSKFTDKTTGNQTSSIDKVPRVFVKSLNDRVLSPDQQDAMIKLWPPCEVHEIASDHDSPISKPELIAAFIVNASLSYGV